MAIRNTKHITKNSDIVNRPLATDLLKGEAIVNTADGILWYSGVTTSTSEWTPAGTGATANYFEVGSNLYDLQIRNKITKYEDISGAGLVGKFLSGTTNGFVLADITSIAGIDTFATGFTYTSASNELAIQRNQGLGDLTININEVSGLTVNGTLTAQTIDASNILSGGTNLSTLIDAADTYVTGGTVTSATDDTNAGTINLTYKDDEGGSYTLPFENTYLTGGTLSGSNLLLDMNSGVQESIDLSGLDTNDTFVTGMTFSSSVLTLERNEGEANLTALIDTLTGLTVTNLTAGRVVYVGTGGLLTDEAGFTYDTTTNTLSTPTDGRIVAGTGGLEVGSGGSIGPGPGDVVIHGDLTVFGDAISAFTSELYVEDPQITLNYNPTGNTNSTSVGSGWIIQDGDGASNDVNLEIRPMDTFTGLTAGNIPDITEYGGSTGYSNRAWVTQLNDIVIRSTATGTPNGVRVLAEFDVLDGGTY